MWKFQDFSSPQILREINFETIRVTKTVFIDSWISILPNFSLEKLRKFAKIKIQSQWNCLNCGFAKNWFHIKKVFKNKSYISTLNCHFKISQLSVEIALFILHWDFTWNQFYHFWVSKVRFWGLFAIFKGWNWQKPKLWNCKKGSFWTFRIFKIDFTEIKSE